MSPEPEIFNIGWSDPRRPVAWQAHPCAQLEDLLRMRASGTLNLIPVRRMSASGSRLLESCRSAPGHDQSFLITFSDVNFCAN
jgi:hypothetical protein